MSLELPASSKLYLTAEPRVCIMLCSGTFDFRHQTLKQEACFGDSGGPLMVKNTFPSRSASSSGSSGGSLVQIGVVSMGSGFCGGFLGVHAPDLYTRVLLYLPWIR